MNRARALMGIVLIIALNFLPWVPACAQNQPAVTPPAATPAAPAAAPAAAAAAAPTGTWVAAPAWLNSGNNAWQLAAATFVALQSIPGLMILYAGLVKKKWAINSAFMVMYAFASVMVVWVLWAYNMSFGPKWFPFLGQPGPAVSAGVAINQATVPEAASGMPDLTFPMATMTYFQFVFAAITVIILGGSVLGRMSFKAWVIFVPLWMTFIYTIGCFSIWGGGSLAQAGAVDFCGGHLI